MAIQCMHVSNDRLILSLRDFRQKIVAIQCTYQNAFLQLWYVKTKKTWQLLKITTLVDNIGHGRPITVKQEFSKENSCRLENCRRQFYYHVYKVGHGWPIISKREFSPENSCRLENCRRQFSSL